MPREPQERQCDNCRRKFTPNKPWQKYCTGDCRDAFWQKAREVASAAVRKGAA